MLTPAFSSKKKKAIRKKKEVKSINVRSVCKPLKWTDVVWSLRDLLATKIEYQTAKQLLSTASQALPGCVAECHHHPSHPQCLEAVVEGMMRIAVDSQLHQPMEARDLRQSGMD
jgi:hypothetical protein